MTPQERIEVAIYRAGALTGEELAVSHYDALVRELLAAMNQEHEVLRRIEWVLAVLDYVDPAWKNTDSGVTFRRSDGAEIEVRRGHESAGLARLIAAQSAWSVLTAEERARLGECP